MLDSATVKKIARDMGADLVGIAQCQDLKELPSKWIRVI